MSKRKLHVIDEAIKQVEPKHWKNARECAQLAMTAGRFIFSDDASRKLGHIVRETADLLLKNHQFAIPPVEPASYVELNLHEFHKALGAPTTASNPMFSPMDSDGRVGYLITPEFIQGFAESRFAEYESRITAGPTPFLIRKVNPGHKHMLMPVAFSPMGYSSDELMAKTQEIMSETMEWNRLAVLLGSSLHHMPDEETRQAFLNNWAIEYTYHFINENTIKYLMAGAGELRTVQAMLLALNQPQVIQYTSVGRAVGLSRGKRTVYHSHSVIDIDLGKRKQTRRLFAGGTHATPARHRVRGHFVHYHTKKGCEHDWPLAPERIDPPAWTCKRCGGLRVWKKHFLRGDASKGFVTNEYNVEGEKHV